MRSRALPALDRRVLFLTLVPDRYSRGARPAYAAACWAVANRAGEFGEDGGGRRPRPRCRGELVAAIKAIHAEVRGR